MNVFSIVFLASAMSAAIASTPAKASSVLEPRLSVLVVACKSEAMKGHFRLQTTNSSTVQAHRDRMKLLCVESTSLQSDARSEWLARCQAESRVAANPFRRGNLERMHVLRHLRLCGELAAASDPDAD